MRDASHRHDSRYRRTGRRVFVAVCLAAFGVLGAFLVHPDLGAAFFGAFLLGLWLTLGCVLLGALIRRIRESVH